MRAHLRFERRHLRAGGTGSLRRRLRSLAALLGEVRDRDVLLAHAGRHPNARAEGAALSSWTGALRAERESAMAALARELASPSHRRLLADLEAFAAGGARPRRPGPRLRDILPAAVWTQYARVRRFEADPDPDLPAFHRLRIECKRLRYLLDAFRDAFPPGRRSLSRAPRDMQDALGSLQDAVVCAERLRSWRVRAGETPGGAGDEELRGYLESLEREIASRRAACREAFASVGGAAYRRRLARSLAEL